MRSCVPSAHQCVVFAFCFYYCIGTHIHMQGHMQLQHEGAVMAVPYLSIYVCVYAVF
jgi:hypothetical protein